ncbi:MAG TPA: ABC transporter substrate-binding protein [Candidatus Obscuribacterales bacterium]
MNANPQKRGQKWHPILAAVSLMVIPMSATIFSVGKAATPPAAAPIKIGFVASLSGVGADPSKDMENGIRLWLEQCHGKVAGRDVQLIVENDESNPATAVAKVKKLVDQDKVDVLDGLLLANIGYKVAPVVEEAKMPMIYAVCASDDLTQRKRSHWIVRTSYTSSQASHPFGEYVAKKLGYKRVVTIGMDYPYGYETVGGFQDAYENSGGQVVQKLWAPLGFRDFSQQLSKIRPDADAIYLCTTSAAAELFPHQYKESGLKLPIVACSSSYDEVILPHLGDDALNAISAANYSAALDNAANKKFVAEYRAKYQADPSGYAADAYVSGQWIQKAIEILKGDVSDKTKLLATLKKVELKDSPRGPVKLDDFGNVVENIYVRKVEKKSGKLQNTVIATFKDVSQFWKWNPDDYLKRPAYSRDYPACSHCQ